MLAQHELTVEWMSQRLKSAATQSLRRVGLHPFERFVDSENQVPTVWANGRWTVYLKTPADIVRSVDYTSDNPRKELKPCQRWSFVKPYTV